MEKCIFLVSQAHELLETLRFHAPPWWKIKLFTQFESFRSASPAENASYVFIDCLIAPQYKRNIINYLYEYPATPFFYVCNEHFQAPILHPVIKIPHDLPLLFNSNTLRKRYTDLIDCICGTSSAICSVREKILLAAKSDIPVLFTGKSGTGKTLAAKTLHNISRRKSAPFYSINVAAIPPFLAEAELFGTERGAFTDAERRAGYVSSAQNGTLFLDEIAELDMQIQAKLLHVLESGNYRSVGSDKEKHSNIRLIFATNADLRQKVRERSFREDLFYRISKFVIQMPSLAERSEDIGTLCTQFLATRGKRLTPQAIRLLQSLPWNGNIRQLFSCLEYAALCTNAKQLDIQDIAESMR